MANAHRHVVFRVNGLSNDNSEWTLKTTIETLLSEAEKDIGMKITVVPSCDLSEQTSIGLVDFYGGVPSFLSTLMENPLGTHEIELGLGDQLSFDRHFHGFTQLYSTSPSHPITTDIVAITGIDGHAYGSWRGKGPTSRMWLRDFLSKDLPQCRTMIYGYDSKLSTYTIHNTEDYSRQFLEQIQDVRCTHESRERPLFFIAHSYGGIILARCLVKALQANEKNSPNIRSLYKATYGILFFAVPHKGLIIEDMKRMLENENHPRAALLEQIKQNSDLLLSQLGDLTDLIRDRKIVTFYETRQSRQLELDQANSSWGRTGNYSTVLDTSGAILQLPSETEIKIPVDADHSTIIKFDNRHTAGYKSALKYLKQFEQDAPDVVKARFLKISKSVASASTIPFGRDTKFVGRDGIITRLDETYSTFDIHCRAALIGIGGIGKSQIAIEYAYRLRSRFPEIWVFWVYSGSFARFEQAYREIAIKIELPDREEPYATVLQLVVDWLNNKDNGPWLMILDGADDAAVFFNHSNNLDFSSDLENLILVTSRDRTAAYGLVGDYENIIHVGAMSESESFNLLSTRLPVDPSMEEDAKELLAALEYNPLAITQAGAYMREMAPMMTVQKYLVEFRRDKASQMTLLNYHAEDLRRNPEATNAVLRTLEITFKQIHAQKPAAANLLAFMCVFDRQGIPELLLRQEDDYLTFVSTVAPLINFSLITTDSEGSLFHMHWFVQIATRRWLELDHQLGKWELEALLKMSNIFPGLGTTNLSISDKLISHAEIVLQYKSTNESYELQRASLLFNVAHYSLSTGRYQSALDRLQEVVEIRCQWLTKDDDLVLGAINSTGLALQMLGRYEHAETVARHVVERCQNRTGYSTFAYVMSLSALALALGHRGEFESALALDKNIFLHLEERLGKRHPHTLKVMNNMSNTLVELGDYKMAEKVARKTLEVAREALGEDHPETLTISGTLASTLYRQGKNTEAEAMTRQNLDKVEKKYGSEHPATLLSVHNLASIALAQGNHVVAETLANRVIEGRQKSLSPEHPLTLKTLSILVATLRSQNRFKDAEVTAQHVVNVSERTLGSDHPFTLEAINNLALVFRCQEQHEAALSLYRRALHRSKLGPNHPDILTTVNNLAVLLTVMGKYEEAQAMAQRAVDGFKQCLGQDHPLTLDCMDKLSDLLLCQEKSQGAETMSRRMLKGRVRILGSEHPDTFVTASRLRLFHCLQGKHKMAEAMNRHKIGADDQEAHDQEGEEETDDEEDWEDTDDQEDDHEMGNQEMKDEIACNKEADDVRASRADCCGNPKGEKGDNKFTNRWSDEPIEKLISSWTNLDELTDVYDSSLPSDGPVLTQWPLRKIRDRFILAHGFETLIPPILCPRLRPEFIPGIFASINMSREKNAEILKCADKDPFFIARRVLAQKMSTQLPQKSEFATWIAVEQGKLFITRHLNLTADQRAQFEQDGGSYDLTGAKSTGVRLETGDMFILPAQEIFSVIYTEDSLLSMGSLM